MPDRRVRTTRNRARKPQPKTLILWDAISAVAAEYERMSVRQLFYQLVSRGWIEKTERGYKKVCDASTQMRLNGVLPYSKIVDGHRVRRYDGGYSGVAAAMESMHQHYRRNYWQNQPVHIEIWTEKDALSGILWPICSRYQVHYLPIRGFDSLTIIYEAAQDMLAIGKPVVIFYFGDHDASGRCISDNLEPRLREHGVDATVVRMALNLDQVERFNLPTRLGKTKDSRHKGFVVKYGDASVELDALPPNELERLVEEAIRSMIIPAEWDAAMRVEEMERATLGDLKKMIS